LPDPPVEPSFKEEGVIVEEDDDNGEAEDEKEQVAVVAQ
jgi:hypothetical protein